MRFAPVLCLLALPTHLAHAQDDTAPPPLEQRLLREGAAGLALAAREKGDATRGAIVFHRQELACGRCHSTGAGPSPVGPDLSRIGKEATDAHIVESLLDPSRVIKKEFQALTVLTDGGRSFTGLPVRDDGKSLVLRDASGQEHTVDRRRVEESFPSKVSLMPTGLVNQLGGEGEFLDLARYLMEIAAGGPTRAAELRPPPSFLAQAPLPEYESHLDHAGLIAGLGRDSFERGRAIYQRVCANCHGTATEPGSLPTSPRFASGQFKNGSDPYAMYRTLTHGFGLMAPQTWMVPEQKYDVIHYIREEYLRRHNPSQYADVGKDYLAALPKGDTRGPRAVNFEPWVNMDYGPSLTHTVEFGGDGSNIAFKGISVRLDPGPGGVSRGRYWVVYDEDTMRVAAAYGGKGFIDWNGILFNGAHAVHPRAAGAAFIDNPMSPGWAGPDGGFADPRLVGRDGRRYGPLPHGWMRYRGLYHYGDRVILSYSVGGAGVLEMPGVEAAGGVPVFTRTFRIGPRDRDMTLQVARQGGANATLSETPGGAAVLGPAQAAEPTSAAGPPRFDGATYLEADGGDFDLHGSDYTIRARLRTKAGGTIFARTDPGEKWVPDGKALFVRGGRLVFDIGWGGAVQAQPRIDDGRLHDVAMTYEHKTGTVRLFVDGQQEGQGKLQPKAPAPGHVVRVGFAAPDFPRPQSFFDGNIDAVQFYSRALSADEIARPADKGKGVVALWQPADARGDTVPDGSGRGHGAKVVRGDGGAPPAGPIVAGLSGEVPGARWLSTPEGDLRLRIPAGKQTLKFTLWVGRADGPAQVAPLLAALPASGGGFDLEPLTKGGPMHWGTVLRTKGRLGGDDGPFAVDVLDHPDKNPWAARLRFSGLDFFPGGHRAALCTWDGDVWFVDGVDRPEIGLAWRRVASGMFQPLGLKIVDGQVYVCCRDQIAILRDLNGDGETDFYENFNNDHQVTEHFHEFAMGLQTDADGNFYYARAARHAKTALVPHHGTLLKVSKDGSETTIVATGFRAPNGVCVNGDGTFLVTDQEGHWNPKNRINWVKPGGFYGNMWGYHDVTDTSDDAMEPPLCWITNAFDRSPSELLWVDSDRWGPLKGSLLNLSYGYGKVFVVPHQKVGDLVQGGMAQLPIPQFPTGVMRGRFISGDGQLYLCGMFAWGGNQQQDGGLYRVRYTGRPVHLPVGLDASKRGLTIRFSGDLDPKTAADPAGYAVKVWDIRRSQNYGSQHYGEKNLPVTGVDLGEDRRTVLLHIDGLEPTRCMEIRYTLRGSNGEPVDGVIHNTIHKLAD